MSYKKSLVILFLIIALSFFLLTSSIPLDEGDRTGTAADFPPLQNSGKLSILDPTHYSLQVLVSMPVEQFRVLEQLNRNFIERFPNIEVELVNTTRERLYGQWKEDAVIGKTTDILLLDNEWLSTYAAHGLLTPLTETEEPLNGIVNAISNQMIWNGYTWGAPLDMDPYVLVWNKAVLSTYREGSGLMTYEEWEELYHQWFDDALADRTSESYVLYFDTKDPYAVSTFGWATGSLQELSSGHLNVVLELDESLEQWSPWFDTASSVEHGTVDLAKESWKMLKEGSLLFKITRLSDIEAYGDGTIGFSPIPVVQENGGNAIMWLRGRSFAVHAQVSSKEQAIAWIHEMTSEHAQQQLSQSSGTLPATVAAIRPSSKWGLNEVALLREWIGQAKTLPADPKLSDRLAQVQQAPREQDPYESMIMMMRTIYQTETQTNSP